MRIQTRKFLEAKVKEIDEKIDNCLNSNQFFEAQDAEIELRYWEDRLLKTYNSGELFALHNEGYPHN